MSVDEDILTGPGLDHRGLTYTDRASLVAAAVPLIRRALAGGSGVVVVVDRATARELDGTLTRADAARIRFPSPTGLGGHGSPAFTRSLSAWASDGGRVLVLTQYAPGPRPGIDPALAALPITLLCACARDAEDAVLSAFEDQHDVTLSDRFVTDDDVTDDGVTATLETTIGDASDLIEVRRGIRRLAVGVGFGGSSLDRTVLAVHEACALACHLLHHTAGTPDPDPARRCWIEARAVAGTLRAEVVVPGGVDAGERTTGLAHVRPFCQEASVHDGVRSRAIRVLAVVGG